MEASNKKAGAAKGTKPKAAKTPEVAAEAKVAGVVGNAADGVQTGEGNTAESTPATPAPAAAKVSVAHRSGPIDVLVPGKPGMNRVYSFEKDGPLYKTLATQYAENVGGKIV